MKVFIVQPMTGRTVEEILKERQAAIQDIKDQSWDKEIYIKLIDNFNPNALNDGEPLVELGKCISLLNEADMVYFAKDWQNSKGCRAERAIVELYDLDYISYDRTDFYFSPNHHWVNGVRI